MSKPNVYFFNPTCELAVANGSFSYMPPSLLQEMESDLAILPFIFASENDFVLTENAPSGEFLAKLKEAGFKLPGFASIAELETFPSDSFDSILPWGWSPSAHFKLKNLKGKCSANFKNSPVFNWHENHQLLYERSSSLDFLAEILSRSHEPWMMDIALTGKKVYAVAEIEQLLKEKPALVLKAPLSSSGRGIQIMRKPILNLANRQWISGILKQQKYLMAEPLLDKLADLSFQFEIGINSEINLLGYSLFKTNTNGQYKGTQINGSLDYLLQKEEQIQVEEMIKKTARKLEFGLTNSVYRQFHRGFLGIDSMLFKDGAQIRMQPCIEVNCRMNMGILALKLESFVHHETKGSFELFYGKQGDFMKFTQQNENTHPTQLKNNKSISGFLALIEATESKKFGAYFYPTE